MGAATNVISGAASGAGLGMQFGGPIGAGIGAAAGGILGGVQSIGAGRRTANNFVQSFEDQLAKKDLPRVIQMAQAGDMEGAKALLQTAVKNYYTGIQQYQAGGGNYAKVAQQSLSNQALQSTISNIAQGFGFSYTPGVGLSGGPAAKGGDDVVTQSTWNQDEANKKGDLYGLKAPMAQGDPYAVSPVEAQGSDLMAAWLKGQGYDPKTLAQMHAGATQGAAGAGLQETSQAKRALSQAGLFGSPAAAATIGQIAKQTGQAQMAANRDVDINNAQAALGNQKSAFDAQNNLNIFNANAKARSQEFNANQLNNRYSLGVNALAG